MDHFFQVRSLEKVLEYAEHFPVKDSEAVPLEEAPGRVLAGNIVSAESVPGFRRATMDGYAVFSGSTFGASETSPAWLEIVGSIRMGEIPGFELAPGTAAEISTGGMLPAGADSVVMIEHTEQVDDRSVEVYKSVAPLQNVIDASEDFAEGETVIEKGMLIRPQEAGLMAALGYSQVNVHRRCKVGIISTGDEIVPVDKKTVPGQIRDMNSYTLAGLVSETGNIPRIYGIVEDSPEALYRTCKKAAEETDMVMVSGGSSVGTRDFTIEVFESLAGTDILVHGVSISPGKPTILAKSGAKPLWGLPGQVTSAMVVFKIVAAPFLNRISGHRVYVQYGLKFRAQLTRNLSSVQGRREFVRVKLTTRANGLKAEPVLGKSGLIRTMVKADGLLEIGENEEGLKKGTLVDIIPI
ncbi:MAG: molybdopterin molybdotransferase MoeA [Desulfobacteraceae bacterium]